MRATRSGSPTASPSRIAELAHDLLAVLVSERVRRLAEAVDREQHQRQRFATAQRLRERPAQALAQQHAVGQPGQLVVVAQPVQGLLGQPLLGDVEHETADEASAAVLIEQHAPLVAPPEDAAVAVQQAVLAGEAHAVRAGVAILLQDALAVLRVQARRPAGRRGQPVRRGEPGHQLELRADVRPAAVLVRPRHVRERRDLLDQRAIVAGVLVGRRCGAVSTASRRRRRSQAHGVADANAVPGARPHQLDQLGLAEALAIGDDGGRSLPSAPELDHARCAQLPAGVRGDEQVAGRSQQLELRLTAREVQDGLGAAALDVGGEGEGRLLALGGHHHPRRCLHALPVSSLSKLRGTSARDPMGVRSWQSRREVDEVGAGQVERATEAEDHPAARNLRDGTARSRPSPSVWAAPGTRATKDSRDGLVIGIAGLHGRPPRHRA